MRAKLQGIRNNYSVICCTQYMLFFTAVLRLGEAPGTAPVDTDSYDRIMLAMQALVSGGMHDSHSDSYHRIMLAMHNTIASIPSHLLV